MPMLSITERKAAEVSDVDDGVEQRIDVIGRIVEKGTRRETKQGKGRGFEFQMRGKIS